MHNDLGHSQFLVDSFIVAKLTPCCAERRVSDYRVHSRQSGQHVQTVAEVESHLIMTPNKADW
jgi:hypothetical protein